MAKEANRFTSEDGKKVWEELEKIVGFGYDRGRVFGDWIDLALNCLLSLTENFDKPDVLERVRTNRFEGIYNDRYLKIVQSYRENGISQRGERPIDYHAHAWGMLVAETRAKERDILGRIYMEQISHGDHGQFFSPHDVGDLIAAMTVEGYADGQSVYDPCCGSGRYLLAVAKQNPTLLLYGQDIELRCAKMAALNMWLFDLNAFIRCGNSLTNSWQVGWEIQRGGYLWERYPPQGPEGGPGEKPEPPVIPGSGSGPEQGRIGEKVNEQLRLPL